VVLACCFVRGEPVTDAPPKSATDTLDYHVNARKTVEYLASEELQGRLIGTPGIDLAADYIADTFGKLKLKTLPGLEDYFQPFSMVTSVVPDPSTSLAWKDVRAALKTDFQPVSFSGEGSFDAPVVFVGYGISSKKNQYDDYAGIDVKGKVVLALRYEPHDEHGKSRFNDGKDGWSTSAALASKAQAAIDHGAAAVLLVNPPTYHEGDELMAFARNIPVEKVSIPFIQIKQALANRLLKMGGGANDLEQLQARIDMHAKPNSFALGDVPIKGDVKLKRNETKVKNVAAMLPGSGAHADEYVVIGAHYDHLGRGGPGSLAPFSKSIHPGADDNASGTAAMLAMADHFAHSGPEPRSLIFIAFTAEEEGLIGSKYFVDHPPVPLAKIAAMLNLDMVGRVRNEKLSIGGAGTAASLESVVDNAAKDQPLKLQNYGKGGMGPSDHMSFALKKIPVVFFFSGLHLDYHRPTDVAEKVNFQGIDEVVNLGTRVVGGMARMPHEKYVGSFDFGGMAHAGLSGQSSGATLGVVPDYTEGDTSIKGVKITGTVPGSPADTAGLRENDIVVQLGDSRIDTLVDLSNALAKNKPGDKVRLVILRGQQKIESDVVLGQRKG
jgi:hypothetical protein